MAADLGTTEGVATLLEHVAACDILVNNLGVSSTSRSSTSRMTNFGSILSGQRHERRSTVARLSARMMARGWGRIVFISAKFGVNIPAEMVHYGMTKTAQLAMSRGLAEVGGRHRRHRQRRAARTDALGGGRAVRRGTGRSRGTRVAEVEAEFFRTVRPSS